jgi:[acyl-carrier-protein] S-malonyltransferase/trans-AT polyketide synthase/acyltransferase/oxidoreductase domain-containing protein
MSILAWLMLYPGRSGGAIAGKSEGSKAMDENSSAAVFPGQGVQRPGMGQDFCNAIPESRRTYEEAADALGWDVAELCFTGDERLNLTEYTQPCILTTEMAMLRGLAARWDFRPSCFGGHSLGEWTALVAAGALPFAEALRIVQERGRLMQRAVAPGVGAMTAVIAEDLDPETIENLLGDLAVDIANVNSSRQIVLSGEASAVAAAESILGGSLADRPSLRFTRLNVSAPFHSRLMGPILTNFFGVLRDLNVQIDPVAAGRVASNYRGAFHSGSGEEVREALILQISHTVRWRQNMAALAERAAKILEIGPGRLLKNFFQTIGVECFSVTTFASAERTFAAEAKRQNSQSKERFDGFQSER